MKKSSLLFCFLFVTACASYRPVVDENPHYLKVGEAHAEQDIDNCMARADRYLEKHKSERMRKEVGRGAATGAIMGGVVGLLSGGSALQNTAIGAGVGAGVGAGMGAAGQASKDRLSPDAMKQRYVTNCLTRKGYQVIGWK